MDLWLFDDYQIAYYYEYKRSIVSFETAISFVSIIICMRYFRYICLKSK